MAISKGNQPVNSFVKGLITEVSPLSFPEQASLDEVNFKLKHDGTRERRLGLDYENGYTVTTTSLSASNLATATQSAFRWPNPNGSTSVDIGVIQLGRFLYFINLLDASPSTAVLNGGSPIDTTLDNESRFEFAVLNNYLIAINPNLLQPYLVSYNDVTDVISYETAAILIRDLYGVDDDLRVDERPTVLSEKHKYNLRNQGWSPSIVSTCGTDALDCTFSTFGVYPSNADQWGIGRIADLANADVDKYDPNIAKRNILNNGQVPRGHYIIRAFFRGTDRTDRSGIILPLDRETSYITTVAGYAGRAWYSGIRGLVSDGDDNSPRMSNAILYSQIFRTKIDLIKCYQENDPTSYKFSDLIDTDGGVIHIPECSNIVKLMAIKHSLFVFAENGVWEIKGDDGGFRATSFQVNKISNVGVYSPQSIIEVNGVIYFWAITGIYSIVPNAQLANVWDTNNITLDTIQRLYNSIPDIIKKGAKGYYDLKSNTARWLYTSDDSKIVGNPIDVVTPVPITSFLAATAIGGLFDTDPKIAKLSATKSVMIYKKYLGATTTIFYKVLTVNTTTGVTTAGAEQTLVVLATAISGYAICYLQDNKVVVGHKRTTTDTYLTIGNYISGDSLTWSTAVSINTTMAPILRSSDLRITRITANRVLVSAKNTDNDKPSAQVVDISSSDVITYGTVAKSSSINSATVNVAKLTATKFIVSWTTTATTVVHEIFNISGTTITWAGSAATFPTAIQFPAPTTTRQCQYGSICRVTDASAMYIGVGTHTISTVVNYAPDVWIAQESSSVVTSTTGLFDIGTLSTTSANNSYPQANSEAGYNVACYGTSSRSGDERLEFLRYTGSTTPVHDLSLLLDSSSSYYYTNPEMAYLGSGLYSIAVMTNNAAESIKVYSVTIA